jgi:quercetin dioxygenase-like cupin family protein
VFLKLPRYGLPEKGTDKSASVRFTDQTRYSAISEAFVGRKLNIVFLKRVIGFAELSPDKMTKTTLAQGDFLFAGLNSFEPGQEHALHSHEGQEKLYVVLEGSGVVRIGEETERLSPGDAAFARSGVIHSIRNPGPDRLVVMVVLAPPPSK